MLEAFSLAVHLLDGIVQHLVKKCLQQPVMAHDFERAFSAGGRHFEVEDPGVVPSREPMPKPLTLPSMATMRPWNSQWRNS